MKYGSLYNGWFNTGDIGYIDENSELHICSRIDDVMMINSHKIYPIDVENVICDVDGVEECAVAKIVCRGIDMIGCLYVGNASADNIIMQTKSKLATYEIPQNIIKVNDLPKSSNGKLLRSKVKQILEGATG